MKKRIMVVDDEDDVNVTLRIVLEDQFSVDVFNDPFVALDNFKPGLYDLLLIDIRMPKMNGLVLCNKLQKIDSKVKVCFITAGEMVFDFALRKFPGCTILKKPIDNYDLLKEVTRMTKCVSLKKSENKIDKNYYFTYYCETIGLADNLLKSNPRLGGTLHEVYWRNYGPSS